MRSVSKSLQRRVGDGANLRRTAVEPSLLPCSMWKPNLVAITTSIADRLERLTDDVLVGIGAVHFGRIEERHACVNRRADDRDPVLTAQRLSVALADSHTAKTERRNLQSVRANSALLHAVFPLRHRHSRPSQAFRVGLHTA